MTREEAINYLKSSGMSEEQIEAIASAFTCDYYDYEAKTCRRAEPCEDCISRQAVLDKIKEICFSKEQKWVDFRVSQGSNGQRNLIINFIEDLPSIQPKDIYNKGWQDGAEAIAYHIELCKEENPTIPMSVIEDIKAEIEKTVCEELNYCDVELSFLKWCAGLKYSLRIIDKHIEDIGGK